MLRAKKKTILSTIGASDSAILYPSFGHREPNGRYWRIYVRGFIHEPAMLTLRKRLMLNFLSRMMQATPDDLESALFRERSEGFLVGPKKGRWIVIRIGRHIFPLRKTNRHGHFFGKVRLTNDQVDELRDEGQINGGWLRYALAIPDQDERELAGAVQLVSPQGFSVISDIDDTIKHTEVLCRKSMLANTFLKEFRPIEGMAPFYQALAELGASFHYVSYSPWQIFRPLESFSSLAGYPRGPFHLRSFQLTKHMLGKLLLSRSSGKTTVVRWILRSFPNRQFLLIGDSGQHDPEIYGAVARKHADQVAGILIREVAPGQMSPIRLEKAFAQVDPSRWSVFRDPGELETPLVFQGNLGQYNVLPAT